MNMKNFFLPGLSLCLLAALCSCSTSKQSQFTSVPSGQTGAGSESLVITNPLSADLLRPSPSLFTLGPGDKLEIEVIGHPETRAETFVTPDGNLYFHLAPGLDVWGLTLTQARERLEGQLANFFTQPQVSFNLREVASKSVWLLGRLTRPGVYPLTGPTTVLEAFALAGGPASSTSQISTEELADLRHSFVMRQAQLLPVDFERLLREGDMTQNIYLQPDDFVFVPSALSQEVYVLGAVRAARAVPYTQRLTVVGAIAASAGAAKIDWLAMGNIGVAPDAYLSHVAVVRGSLAQPQLMVIDCTAIIKGKRPDFPLEPGDIVYVPNAPYSTLKRYFNTVVNTFISTVAANEGIRAGGGTTVGVSIPIGH
jgi:protein involved in polysaccharide export with SLBB domain